jgi:hypothetical protein
MPVTQQTKLKGSEKKVATKKVVKKVPKKSQVLVKKQRKAPKVPKVTKVINTKPPRSPNISDTRSKDEGINLSSAKVRNALQHAVNRDAIAALAEIQKSFPSETIFKADKDGKPTSEVLVGAKPGIPLARINSSAEKYLKYVQTTFSSSSQELFADAKIKKMSADDGKKYRAAKKAAKEEHEDCENKKVLEFRDHFSEKKFNLTFDPLFYKGHAETRKVKAKTADGKRIQVKGPKGNMVDKEVWVNLNEWEAAIDMVSRSKLRFSANAKVYISAFLEFLIKQLASNGTYNCINSKKKILKLEHSFDIHSDEFKKRFPLFPIVANYKTTLEALKLVNQRQTDKTKKTEKKDVTQQNELFQVFGDDNKNRLKFKYYIGEICREVKMELAASELNDDGQTNTDYHYASVGSDFSCFSSSLIYELITVIGQMLEVEISSRNIKTINNNVIGTVIRNLHLAARVPFEPTLQFIRDAHMKHVTHTKKRQSDRAVKSPSN